MFELIFWLIFLVFISIIQSLVKQSQRGKKTSSKQTSYEELLEELFKPEIEKREVDTVIERRQERVSYEIENKKHELASKPLLERNKAQELESIEEKKEFISSLTTLNQILEEKPLELKDRVNQQKVSFIEDKLNKKFSSLSYLQKIFVLKEIIDKPLALRDFNNNMF